MQLKREAKLLTVIGLNTKHALNLTHFIQAKHVNFIYKILKAENENWNAIGENWLQTLVQKFGLEYLYVNAHVLNI